MVSSLKAEDKIPVEPFRERFQELQRTQGLSLSEVAYRAGWCKERKNGYRKADVTYTARVMGLKPWAKTVKTLTPINGKENVKTYEGYVATTITREAAVRLARALHLDPWECGL